MKFGRGYFHSTYEFKKLKWSVNHCLESYIGLPQWRSLEWRDSFYPKDARAKNLLKLYSQRLKCVEVSSTFYSQVSSERIKQWCEETPDNFKFLPKWPQEITHHQKLKTPPQTVSSFIESMRSFNSKLGTTLLQLPQDFSTECKSTLFHFLELIPTDFPLSIEFRHESWFHNESISDKLFHYLSTKKISMVCSDTPARRDVFHYSFPSHNTVIRFVSDHNKTNDQQRLEKWRQQIEDSQYKGNLYFIIHKPDNISTPDLIEYLSPETTGRIHELNQGAQLGLL